jgi:hypothetical protein
MAAVSPANPPPTTVMVVEEVTFGAPLCYRCIVAAYP